MAAKNGIAKRRGGGEGRGHLKDMIAGELQVAGKEAIKVKDLAAILGTGDGNVTAFFQSTGKKMEEVKKVGPARHAWAA